MCIRDREESLQPAPVVAYPQEEGYTRITEYKKLPVQEKPGSKMCIRDSGVRLPGGNV